ncbi:hypothetical protein DPMN_118646 [Dreissena polymorpha]|uniref:Bromo domain-containing protein n=1 Tax=Dreissena polymorpha TaxID=45954 RepID=A0A9D4JR99_DREPO|nr:hypothetical protein DPMN_118646 [Dreissena polymorpha]
MYLPMKKDYPDYYKVITDPIDLSTIETKIKGNKASGKKSSFSRAYVPMEDDSVYL